MQHDSAEDSDPHPNVCDVTEAALCKCSQIGDDFRVTAQGWEPSYSNVSAHALAWHTFTRTQASQAIPTETTATSTFGQSILKPSSDASTH